MKYHGGHIVLSLDWEGTDWWKPRAYTIREDDGIGPVYGFFIGCLGLGLFAILYRAAQRER